MNTILNSSLFKWFIVIINLIFLCSLICMIVSFQINMNDKMEKVANDHHSILMLVEQNQKSIEQNQKSIDENTNFIIKHRDEK